MGSEDSGSLRFGIGAAKGGRPELNGPRRGILYVPLMAPVRGRKKALAEPEGR